MNCTVAVADKGGRLSIRTAENHPVAARHHGHPCSAHPRDVYTYAMMKMSEINEKFQIEWYNGIADANTYHGLKGKRWRDRCPKCFSRELKWWRDKLEFRQCRTCLEKFNPNDVKLNMPMDGFYLDVPRGAETVVE